MAEQRTITNHQGHLFLAMWLSESAYDAWCRNRESKTAALRRFALGQKASGIVMYDRALNTEEVRICPNA